jgi:hypothetical protein
MLACHGRLTSAALGGHAVRAFAGETATCAIYKRSFTRAAGVSPPWYGNRAGSTERFLSNKDARMPRGAYAPRSWCSARRSLAGKITPFAMHKRTIYKSGEPSARRGSGIAPANTERLLPNEDARMPRGACAPPLFVVLRCGHLPVKLRLVRYTNARLQERRPSARRG